MRKIRTYNAISAKGLNRFPRETYEVASEINHPDAILLRSHKLHDEVLPESVVAVARAGAGVNNVPVEDYTKKGVVVFNTPGANANAVKELVLAGLLLGSRDIIGGISFANAQTEEKDNAVLAKLMEKSKKQFAGGEIQGKTLGVVGLGAIGSMVANMALSLGMNVIGYDPALSVDAAWRLSRDVKKAENLQSLLANSDFITLHVPAIDATRHLLNNETFASLKKGATLLNFAREEIVDTDAAIGALDAGQMKAYISDFPCAELIGRDDVILMPHIGASTAEAEENCAVMAANQLMDFLENGNITNSVNFPQIYMERSSGHRITLSNENVPKVLGHVLSVLADNNINVIDMLNKSRNDIAYNIIDVEQAPSDDVIEAIRNVESVISIRVLS